LQAQDSGLRKVPGSVASNGQADRHPIGKAMHQNEGFGSC
jgi:hypothetical protein